jgi:hypothetical protein
MAVGARRWLAPVVFVLFAAGCSGGGGESVEAGGGSTPRTPASDEPGSSQAEVTLGSSAATSDPGASAPTASGTGTDTEVPVASGGENTAATESTQAPSNNGSTNRPVTPTPDQKSQTITFPPLPAPWRYGEGKPLSASATSGLPVSLSASGACRVANAALGLVQATDVGPCRITASQPGGSGWAPAADITQTATISKAVAAIQSFGNQSFEYQQIAFTIPLGASVAGGAPVRYVLLDAGQPDQLCSLSGSTLAVAQTFNSMPTVCVVQAVVDASRLYEAASAQATITITPTVVKFTSQRVDIVAGPAAQITVGFNRKWTVSADNYDLGTCGTSLSVDSFDDLESHVVTVGLAVQEPDPAPKLYPCRITLNTGHQDGTFRPDSTVVEIKDPPPSP